MRFEFVPPAQLQPETLPTLGLPCCAATFHAPQVTGALQVWLVGLHDPLLQSLSATQVPPVPHRLAGAKQRHITVVRFFIAVPRSWKVAANNLRQRLWPWKVQPPKQLLHK